MLIRNAEVLTADGLNVCDVLIRGESIEAVGPGLEVQDEEVIEATGMVLGPGFVDLHVHFREPGETWKEDFRTGAATAAAGGFTAVVAMPNTKPTIDTAATAHRAMEAAADCPIEILVAGALTAGQKGEGMASLDDLYGLGVRLFTDDGRTVADGGLMRDLMRYLEGYGDVIVAQHCEDLSISDNGHMHEGEISQRLGIPGLPASAEESILARDLVLAEETGVHLHVQHVSSAGSVTLIERARERGIRVTSEVTPHHLSLTDSSVEGLDTNFKMYPPLRTEIDRAGLVDAVLSGVIDAVATDHAPHSFEEKDVPFEDAPRGVIGLETAFPATFEALGRDLQRTFEVMSLRPAEIIGSRTQGSFVEAGAKANLVLVDPDATWVAESFRSKSSNSPFLREKMTGRVKSTISEGVVVYEENHAN